MDMMDETGEIRATAFNAECDKFYHMIEVDKVKFDFLSPAGISFSHVYADRQGLLHFTSAIKGGKQAVQQYQERLRNDFQSKHHCKANIVDYAYIR